MANLVNWEIAGTESCMRYACLRKPPSADNREDTVEVRQKLPLVSSLRSLGPESVADLFAILILTPKISGRKCLCNDDTM